MELLSTLSALSVQVDIGATAARRATPEIIQMTVATRRNAGATVTSMRNLVSDKALVSDWLADLKALWRIWRAQEKGAAGVREELAAVAVDPQTWSRTAELLKSLGEFVVKQRGFAAALASLEGPSRRIEAEIKRQIDVSTQVAGWEALTRMGKDIEGVERALTQSRKYDAELKAMDKAIADVEKGIGIVVDQKFADLSDGVRKWWDLLRPEEATYFDTIQRRGSKTKRMIDLRAGLALKDDRSDPKFRDAVAVFSQSQLHCLGLSMFLARAVSQSAGFIVLDDPVLTSDDDYRPNFASSVIEALMAEGVQVIILTQDQKTAKDIATRWDHVNAGSFTIVRNDPHTGSEIRNKNDQLAAMIASARTPCSSEDPDQRKSGAQKLRDAIERFCKLILVRDRQAKGDQQASITDYDGKNFSSYSANVKALLIKDKSHPGKLQSAHDYTTPGSHDDASPSRGSLRSALGELTGLKKVYLD